MRRLLSLALLVLVACSADGPEPLPFEPAGPDASPDPSTMGPFPVGVRTLEYERIDDQGKPRKIIVDVWYPAVEAARGGAGVSYDMRTQLTDEQRAKVTDIELPILTTSAVRDAAPRTDRGPYPLVVFSHGQGGMRWQSTFYTVTLASHGYVVVAPDHPGNTIADLLRDQMSNTLEGIWARPLDAIFLIDTFTALPAGHVLSGMIDGAKIGVTGHSFGAITSIRAASLDDRIKAIVPQAPGFTDAALVGNTADYQVPTPALVQASKLDQTLPWDEHVPYTWSRLGGEKLRFDLVTGGHFTYSDLCRFDLSGMAERIGLDGAEVIEDGCGPGAPAAEVALPLINQFAIGFFNAKLRGSEGSWSWLTQAKADARSPGVASITERTGAAQ